MLKYYEDDYWKMGKPYGCKEVNPAQNASIPLKLGCCQGNCGICDTQRDCVDKK